MTSKHLFFKAMREDMRHRGWMIALSVLGSFFALPMAWMIMINNMHSFRFHDVSDGLADLYCFAVGDFWRDVANYLGGLVTAGGALVAALAGFCFVFHKNQADTWHSLPIKRNMLFWVRYVNGVIVWLLPLLVSTVLTAVLSGGMVLGQGRGGAEEVCEVVKLAAGDLAVWTAVFLLVYNLTLLAMMFSGNVLNTIVSMLIMGFGGVSLYGLGFMLCQEYLDTFFNPGAGDALYAALYASPYFSALWLLLERGGDREGYSVWFNLLTAAALAVWAWLLYRRRPSELAEQGIQNRGFSTALRFVTAAGAGVGGWLFFYAVTDYSVLWGIFGAVLAAVLVHGVLDVVFRMDFRAFFAHRLQMAGTVAAALLICFAFYGDWFGYDTYLPKKEQIADIGIKVESLSNRVEFMRVWYPLGAIKYQDTDTAYAFLQAMTEAPGVRGSRTESVETRITLKNGRTYYRRYFVSEGEREAVMPIVSSGEYLSYAYCLDERVAEEREVTLQFERGTQGYAEKKFAKGELLDLVRAYNQDVLEDPEALLLGEGRILAGVNMSFVRTDGGWSTVSLDIYESMTRTIGALKELGYEELVTPGKAAEIASIGLGVDDFGTYRTAEDIVNAARKRYCVYGRDNAEGQSAEGAYVSTAPQSTGRRTEDLTLYITEPEEIEELLPLISYGSGYKRWDVFKRSFVRIGLTDRKGETFTVYIKEGDLPEKYIQRFGELIQSAAK